MVVLRFEWWADCIEGIVPTPMILQEMKDAVSLKWYVNTYKMNHDLTRVIFTAVTTVLDAYERYLDDTLHSLVIECSADKQFFLEAVLLTHGHV